MIKNLWGKIRLYCGNHGDKHDIEMAPHEAIEGQSMFYSCPKYYPDNREEGERACKNHINLKEFERMLACISKEISTAELNNEIPNLTGFEWREKTITYRIMKHTDKHIDVLMINQAALR